MEYKALVLLFDKALRRIRQYRHDSVAIRTAGAFLKHGVYTVKLYKEHGSFQGLASETLESLTEDNANSSRR